MLNGSMEPPQPGLAMTCQSMGRTFCIDITLLERESNRFFAAGLVLGSLLAVIAALAFPGNRRDAVTERVSQPENRHMIVELRIIPKAPAESQDTESAPQSSSQQQKSVAIRPLESPPAKEHSSADTTAVVEQTIPVPIKQEEFPDLAMRDEHPASAISQPETLAPPSWALFPRDREEGIQPEPIPPEKVRDERREFKTDIFGIPLNGVFALPVHLGRHAIKNVFWKLRDMKEHRATESMRDGYFSSLTEKQARVLIVVWRDGLADPERLSREDRLFINPMENDGLAEPVGETLADMEENGLVQSLVVNGELVYRASVSRDEVLQSLQYGVGQVRDKESPASITSLIDLISRCFDDSSGTVRIPRQDNSASHH